MRRERVAPHSEVIRANMLKGSPHLLPAVPAMPASVPAPAVMASAAVPGPRPHGPECTAFESSQVAPFSEMLFKATPP